MKKYAKTNKDCGYANIQVDFRQEAIQKIKSSCVKSPNRKQMIHSRDFPGGAVVKTPRSQCRGPGFYPWSGN